MKFSPIYLLSLASLLHASSIEPTSVMPDPISQSSPTPTPTPISIYTHIAHYPQPPSGNAKSRPNLELRDGIPVPVGPGNPLPDPVQMSPITVFQVHGPDGNIIAIPYTQLFVKVPDQWPAPTPGSIGLGTIQGNVGVVRTQSKRGLPTAVVGEVVERFNGLVKRKGGKVKVNVDANSACARRVGVLEVGVGFMLALGVGVVGIL